MYKFIVLNIKNKKNIFLVFLKFRPSSQGFNKLFIKSMMVAKYKNYFYFYFYFLVC